MEPARSAWRQCLRVRSSVPQKNVKSTCSNVSGLDGLDEGDLVAHLVQLALRLFLVEQREAGGGERRIGERFFQLPAQAGLRLRQWRSCTQASFLKIEETTNG